MFNNSIPNTNSLNSTDIGITANHSDTAPHLTQGSSWGYSVTHTHGYPTTETLPCPHYPSQSQSFAGSTPLHHYTPALHHPPHSLMGQRVMVEQNSTPYLQSGHQLFQASRQNAQATGQFATPYHAAASFGFHDYTGQPSTSASYPSTSNATAFDESPRTEGKPISKRKPKIVFTEGQLEELKRCFDEKHYLTSQETISLAGKLNIKKEEVQSWFHNKRTKNRKQATPNVESTATSRPPKNKPHRIEFKSKEKIILEEAYRTNPLPSYSEKQKILKSLNALDGARQLEISSITNWFANQRAKEKRREEN